ncbi:MAG TPA: 50S ribosomal protein L31 [Anaerolineae bacterium]|nr:50S ribosomal protein L31 [Anaerolineae bacterium]HQK15356.1 50S ribosomal protein L31 [Anaerolineae bacterium]
MKPQIHPQWYPEAKVICACGNVWTVGATVPELHTDVCAKCHPYFTGEQRIVDTEGQVDRFMRRLQAREEALREAELRKSARTSPELAITKLGLGKRMEKLLLDAGLEKVGDVLALLNEKGDEGLTEIKGFGLKALADLKKGLRAQGYVLPGDEAAGEVATAA